MISEQDRLALKEGDIVRRKFRGGVADYVIVATTLSKQYFWVRELAFGDDGFYDESHDLTESKWSVVVGHDLTEPKWSVVAGNDGATR